MAPFVGGVAEMGYRTKPFHQIMERAESSFRELLSIPDTHGGRMRLAWRLSRLRLLSM